MKMRWIQKAKIKKGTLSKQLGISIEKNIPINLLTSITSGKIGTRIKTDSKVKITPLLKRRSFLALTLKRIKK